MHILNWQKHKRKSSLIDMDSTCSTPYVAIAKHSNFLFWVSHFPFATWNVHKHQGRITQRLQEACPCTQLTRKMYWTTQRGKYKEAQSKRAKSPITKGVQYTLYILIAIFWVHIWHLIWYSIYIFVQTGSNI